MTTLLNVTHFEALYPPESRFEEISKLVGFIKQGQSCQVMGLAGVGQSTFLKLLSYNRTVRLRHLGDEQERYHFVLVNFSEVRKKPLIEVTKFMMLSLAESLRERGFITEYDKVNKIFKESIALADELVLFQGLKHALDILILEQDLSIVFLLDRFEEYIPSVTDDFFSNLRVLRNRAKFKFSSVFSSNRPLEDSIESPVMADFADFFIANKIYLPIMDKPGMEFRIKHLEGVTARTLTDAQRKLIIHLSGGFGRLVKNCIQIALSSGEDMPGQINKLTDFFISQQSIQTPLNDIWYGLTPSEQDFLLSGNYTETDQDYPYLRSVGLLAGGTITIPLFQAYLNQFIRQDEQKTENELILFDAERGEIRSGKDIISDRLTSSEFKMLRFLIQQKESIVDREQIIGAVWSDAASTAGVTDQALDQLIFRLRRKIEEDPNNPKHILTIKGRGVRFMP